MRIELTERFQRDVRGFDREGRAAVFEALLSLPAAIGDVHRHAGLGLRKLHRSGIWEARVGLGLRIVFTIDREACSFVRAGTHGEIRRYLRSL
jgi:mRNA-degrading endonuclease YafQ of YafQ-DinJ toxin-antitoxin module